MLNFTLNQKSIFFLQKENGVNVSFLALIPSNSKQEDIHYFLDSISQKYGKLLAKLLYIANRVYNLLPIKFDSSVRLKLISNIIAADKIVARGLAIFLFVA